MSIHRKMSLITSDPILDYDHPNLVALYEMEASNPIADSSPNGYDGTGTSLDLVTGVDGQATVFDGMVSDASTFTGLNTTRPTFSISAWVYWHSGGNQCLVYQDRNILVMPHFGMLTWDSQTGTGDWSREDTTGLFSEDVWFNVVVTFDGVNTLVYKDGVLLTGLTTITGTDADSYDTTRMGGVWNSGTGLNRGVQDLDQLRVFDIVLNASQVVSLYEEFD